MSIRVLLVLCLAASAIAAQPDLNDLELVLRGVISDNPELAAAEELVSGGGKYGQLLKNLSAQDLPVLRTAVAPPQGRTWLLSSQGAICMLPFHYGGKRYEGCHPQGWCCIDPGCTKRATCAEQQAQVLPLLGPRDQPQSACRLPSLRGSFEWAPGNNHSKNTIFMLQGKTWKDDDLLTAVQLANDLDVDFVLLSYAESNGDVEQLMHQLDLRIGILQSNLTAATPGNGKVSRGRFHLVTEPAWHISTKSCWLPPILHTWSYLETVLTFTTMGIQTPEVLPITGLGITGTWSQILPAAGVIDGPLQWAGLSCSGHAEQDPKWPSVVTKNLTGAVALVSRGSCSFYQKARNARAAGARAVIIFSQDEHPINMGCAGSDPCHEFLDIFVVMIGRRAGERLLSALFPNNSSNSTGMLAHFSSQLAGPAMVGLLAGEGGIWRGPGNGLTGFKQEILGMEYQRRLLNRRSELQAKIAKDHRPREADVARMQVFERQRLPGSLTAAWSDEQALIIRNSAYDSLEIELHLDCGGHLDSLCPAWDHEVNLYLCSEGTTSHPTRCQDKAASIGRWITPYGREGRWISDATAALPLLLAAASWNQSATLHLATWQNQWIVSMTFWFARSAHSRGVPLARMQLWQGGHFHLGYNPSHGPMYFKAPSGTSRAMLSMLLTGHGWGKDAANCAEFCNHTHHFRINNGSELVKAHPIAGMDHGCFEQVLEGVVPNQHGTWPYGRAGWCPGKHVDWWEMDVSQWLQRGSSTVNNITYMALVDGVEYDPKPAADGNDMGFGAEIHMAAFLTFYGDSRPSMRGARRDHVELLHADQHEVSVLFP